MANEPLGIVEKGIADRARYGRFAYRAPVILSDPKPLPKVKAKPDEVPLPGVFRARDSGNWRDEIKGDRIRGRIQDIVAVTAAAFDVTADDLQNDSRKRCFAYPRFAAMHVMRAVLRLSVTTIGQILMRDHSTVMAGLRKASQLRRRDNDFRHRSSAIAKELRRRWSVDGQREVSR